MKNIPDYTIADIQLGVGDIEFEKGLALYNKGAVSKIRDGFRGYTATVSGTHNYDVVIDSISYDRGNCNCYIGQKDQLCKHMIALAIALVYKYRPEDTKKIEQPLDQAVCSGEVRDITTDEAKKIKAEISRGIAMIKGYNGPSSKWFQYQDSLTKGARLIRLALSLLPVCEKSVLICIDVLKRLDKKLLSAGVDDSDGTVGGVMCQMVELLNMFAADNEKLGEYIKAKLPKGEVFDWETGFEVMC